MTAQKELKTAKKDSANTYFKSSYADINAVLDACRSSLNNNGITILQPQVSKEGSNGQTTEYVQTVLLHESGEFLLGETKVEVAKKNDPQALGSAITYARRYGLQSFMAMNADDDDGESAMDRKGTTSKPAGAKKTSAFKKTASGNNGSGKAKEAGGWS